MDRRRLICGLRIAWSVSWGILCLLLVMLWVTSYREWDNVQVNMPGFCSATVWSSEGTLSLIANYGGMPNTGWQIAINRVGGFAGELPQGFYFQGDPRGFWCGVPHWFALLLSGIFATIPWLRWSNKFSLRALLIATTLIAVVLATAAHLRLW